MATAQKTVAKKVEPTSRRQLNTGAATTPPAEDKKVEDAPAEDLATNVTSIPDSADIVEQTTGEKVDFSSPEVVASTSKDTVTVVKPSPFKLTSNDGAVTDYEAGIGEMPLSHATHWFAKAMGVKIYKPE